MANDKLDFGKNYVLLNQKIDNHIKAKNNPHKISKADINLSEVENLPLDSEVTAGSGNYVSSGAVFTAINAAKSLIDTKQDKLLINSPERTVADLTSIMIDGINYAVSVHFDSQLNTQSRNGVENRVITEALAQKQPLLASGDSIRIDVRDYTISVLKDNALDETSTGLLPNKLITQALNTKQDTLTTSQLEAVNSGISALRLSQDEAQQNALTSRVGVLENTTLPDVYDKLSQKQQVITLDSKLSSDLVNDTDKVHKFVTGEQIQSWTAKQDALIWTNEGEDSPTQTIKTVGGISLQGSGDIPFPEAPVSNVFVNGVTAVVNRQAFINVPTLLTELSEEGSDFVHEPMLENYVLHSYLDTWHDSTKQDVISETNTVDVTFVEGLSTVATSGSYIDLSDTPTIPDVPITSITVNGQLIIPHDKQVAIVFPTDLRQFDNTQSKFITKEVIDLTNYTPTASLSRVAITGSYTDLSNTPQHLSDFSNDVGFITLANAENTFYTKNYIDTNIQKQLSAGDGIVITNNVISATTVPTIVTISESGEQSSIPYERIKDYAMIILYGYKDSSTYEFTETSFAVDPSAFLSTAVSRNFKVVASMGSGEASVPYNIYITRQGDDLCWETDEVGGNTIFVVTKILGLKGE